jgi:uncharacterized protein (TIGR04222 family)
MNPFALHGPAFLAFYAVVGISALVLQYLWSRSREISSAAQLKLSDPYQIAYLRGGSEEALRVAAVTLMERKLLTAGGRMLAAEPGAEERVDSPVERAVLQLYREPRKAEAMQSSAAAEDTFAAYRAELIRHGLLAGPKTFGVRLIPFCVCALIAAGTGVLKLGIAISEGRKNIWFLIGMLAIFSLISVALYRKRGTRSGNAMLSDLENLFRPLHANAETMPTGNASSDVAMLAAVFGIPALPEVRFPGVYALQPEPSTNDSSTLNNTRWSSGSSGRSGGGSGRGCGG